MISIGSNCQVGLLMPGCRKAAPQPPTATQKHMLCVIATKGDKMTTRKARRAALYLRTSHADRTTENQRRQLKKAAKRAGWAVVIYEDNGVSGRPRRAPGLKRGPWAPCLTGHGPHTWPRTLAQDWGIWDERTRT